ncbi:MAG: GNAT family N-acetyltransferase [Candidatus Accumulibacter sp.]|jgi:phosphinothricin acetyltransferase|nr:GNAT family N-acetyltransferase [Accumulibacter sp.]
METITLRFARAEDARALLAIYAPYVENTPVSFEYEVPSPQAFAQRIAQTSTIHPYLVCEVNGIPAAYAYASRHMERAAYRFDVQTSIYAAPEHHGRRIGTALYGCLFELLAKLGYYNAYAVIAVPNEKSLRLHESMGFVPLCVCPGTGYKFSAWHDVAWLGKTLIGRELAPPERPATPDRLDPGFCAALFARQAALVRTYPRRT